MCLLYTAKHNAGLTDLEVVQNARTKDSQSHWKGTLCLEFQGPLLQLPSILSVLPKYNPVIEFLQLNRPFFTSGLLCGSLIFICAVQKLDLDIIIDPLFYSILFPTAPPKLLLCCIFSPLQESGIIGHGSTCQTVISLRVNKVSCSYTLHNAGHGIVYTQW